MVARKCYSFDFKKKICTEVDLDSHSKVCQKYGLDERMVRRWKSEIKENHYQECPGTVKSLMHTGSYTPLD
ncbi:hypothetical protein ENBRE01_2889 [Enteropsectra breve]|nr:hypothetical protein ENBRE01_2889 [Enteropsectra breve]